jgi:hypothetical protein
MTRKNVWVVLAAAAAVTAVGCANPPAAELSAVDAAVVAAESAEASTYATAELAAVTEAKAELQGELAAQQDKFALLRSYSKATELAAAVKVAAEVAQQKAVEGKEVARAEATQSVADARVVLDEAVLMLEKAPRGKGTQADLEVMKSDLAAVEASLGEANSALAASNFNEARSKAQAAIQAAGQVKAAVEQAVALRAGGRRRA